MNTDTATTVKNLEKQHKLWLIPTAIGGVLFGLGFALSPLTHWGLFVGGIGESIFGFGLGSATAVLIRARRAQGSPSLGT